VAQCSGSFVPSLGIAQAWSHCWTYLLDEGDGMEQDNRHMWWQYRHTIGVTSWAGCDIWSDIRTYRTDKTWHWAHIHTRTRTEVKICQKFTEKV